RLVVALPEKEKLEFGTDVRPPAALRQSVELAAEDLARRGGHRLPVLPLQVGDHQGRPLQPGQPAQAGHVRPEDEVAVTGVPGAHGESLHRGHVHVHGEQVLSAPCPATSDMKNGACMRLPMSRPCMSVMTSSTVSTAPLATSAPSS